MKNMRGLYLNDIPVNTFMEYFNKTNLQPLKFTPKYRDDIIVNEYTFTLAGNTRYYKSMFPFPEISSDITEFFGAGVIVEGTTEAQAINTMFYNPNIPFIYPYRYRVWDKAGNLYKNFIEIQDSLENNIDELGRKGSRFDDDKGTLAVGNQG